MENKFMLLYNDELEPVIVLAKIDYHRNIYAPSDFGEIIGRAGGGRWDIINGTLKLYGVSEDFGKYDIDMAQQAFRNKAVYYFDDYAYDDFHLTKLITE